MNELNHIDIMKHWSDGIHEFCRFYLLSSPLLPQAQETFSGGSKATRPHIWYSMRDPGGAQYDSRHIRILYSPYWVIDLIIGSLLVQKLVKTVVRT